MFAPYFYRENFLHKILFMKYVFILMFLCLIESCFSIKSVPLKGSYQDAPFVFASEKTFDKVWDNLIDFFAQNGIGIKLIDRSSGLIVSEDFSFRKLYTWEDKKGKLKNPNAYLVTSGVRYSTDDKVRYPDRIEGNWNVRIKNSDEKTSINVNITNVRTSDEVFERNSFHYEENSRYVVKTTGVFERKIFEIIGK